MNKIVYKLPNTTEEKVLEGNTIEEMAKGLSDEAQTLIKEELGEANSADDLADLLMFEYGYEIVSVEDVSATDAEANPDTTANEAVSEDAVKAQADEGECCNSGCGCEGGDTTEAA